MTKGLGTNDMSDKILAGRTALVTGASSGLGRTFAKALATAGARVAVAARRTSLLDTLVAEIAATGGEALPLSMDVADGASVEQAFARLEAEWGAADVVIANAGISIQGKSTEIAEADFDRILAVNVKGTFLTARQGAKAMMGHPKETRKNGRIVLIASIGGQTVLPGLTAYCTTKAAIVMMGRSLAREWINAGINVNVICPGYVETELNSGWFASEGGQRQIAGFPRKRLMDEGGLAEFLVYLSSDGCEAVTGSVFNISDGQLI